MDDQTVYKSNNNRQGGSSSTKASNILKLQGNEFEIGNNKSQQNYYIQPSQLLKSDQNMNQIQCYQNLFCSKYTIQSLRKKAQEIEILECCSKPGKKAYDQIQYKRKKQQINKRREKVQHQKQLFRNIKQKDANKYYNISRLLFFLNKLKQQVGPSSVEDYSKRTCKAIFQSQNQNIIEINRIMNEIYDQIFSAKQLKTLQQRQKNHRIIREMLNLPRFFISKEKIQKFVRDTQLQRNFYFLIINNCLGHYSNEANKKMPTQKNIASLKKLFTRQNSSIEQSKEIFKAICSINHGNKYRKEKGEYQYNKLYDFSMDDLKRLQKQTYENIKIRKEISKKEETSTCKKKSGNAKNKKKELEDSQSEDSHESQSDIQDFSMCPQKEVKVSKCQSPKRKWSQQKKIQVRKIFKPNQTTSVPKIIEPIFIIKPRESSQFEKKCQDSQE